MVRMLAHSQFTTKWIVIWGFGEGAGEDHGFFPQQVVPSNMGSWPGHGMALGIVRHGVYDMVYTTWYLGHGIYDRVFTTYYMRYGIYGMVHTTRYIQHGILNIA